MPPPTPKFAFAPDGVPVIQPPPVTKSAGVHPGGGGGGGVRSEEHTSELQSQSNLVCRLLPEKKNPRCVAAVPDAVDPPVRLRRVVRGPGVLPHQPRAQPAPYRSAADPHAGRSYGRLALSHAA